METVQECMRRLNVPTPPTVKDVPSTPGAPPLECLGGIIAIVINYAFIFLGAVCILFLLYGSIRFIVSGGDPKAVKSARDTITYAIIGVILVLLVYVIAHLLTRVFLGSGANLFEFKIKLN